MPRERVIVVDDDPHICRYLQRALAHVGYTVFTAASGREGIALVRQQKPRVVLLDVMLPDADGATVCARIREITDAVIIMVTVRADLDTRIDTLDAGADDYVTKPFQLPELLARMRALQRRLRSDGSTTLRFADVRADPASRLATRGARELHLRPKEFDLLVYFMRQPGRVIDRATIFDDVWRDESLDNSNSVEVHLHHLREKLHGPDESPLLHTIRRAGYVLREAGSATARAPWQE
jgi:two-component system response regulator MprA